MLGGGCWSDLVSPNIYSGFAGNVRQRNLSDRQRSFNSIPREVGDIESEWAMFHTSIAVRLLVPAMVAILELGGGHLG